MSDITYFTHYRRSRLPNQEDDFGIEFLATPYRQIENKLIKLHR